MQETLGPAGAGFNASTAPIDAPSYGGSSPSTFSSFDSPTLGSLPQLSNSIDISGGSYRASYENPFSLPKEPIISTPAIGILGLTEDFDLPSSINTRSQESFDSDFSWMIDISSSPDVGGSFKPEFKLTEIFSFPEMPITPSQPVIIERDPLPTPQEAVQAVEELLETAYAGYESPTPAIDNLTADNSNELMLGEELYFPQKKEVVNLEDLSVPEVELAPQIDQATLAAAENTVAALEEIGYSPDKAQEVVQAIIDKQLPETAQKQDASLDQVDKSLQPTNTTPLEADIAVESVQQELVHYVNPEEESPQEKWVKDKMAEDERIKAVTQAKDKAIEGVAEEEVEMSGKDLLKHFSITARQESEPIRKRDFLTQFLPQRDGSLIATIENIYKIALMRSSELLQKVLAEIAKRPPVKLAVSGESVTERDVDRVFHYPGSQLFQGIAIGIKGLFRRNPSGV